MKETRNINGTSYEVVENPFEGMEKVSLKMIKALLDEHKALLIKYADDEISTREIKRDIDSINSVCVMLGVRKLVKFDVDIF
jgi:predicted DNA-binding transcriptional regulator YafY